MSDTCTANLCIPDFCDFFGGPPDCGLITVIPISIDQIYILLYMAGLQIPLLVQNLPGAIETAFYNGLLKIVIIWSLPYVISLILLFMILVRTQTITFESGLLLIVLLVVVDIISIFWVTQEIVNIGQKAFTRSKTIIQQNWINNENQIKCDISSTIFCPNCSTCDPNTENIRKCLDCKNCIDPYCQ